MLTDGLTQSLTSSRRDGSADSFVILRHMLPDATMLNVKEAVDKKERRFATHGLADESVRK